MALCRLSPPCHQRCPFGEGEGRMSPSEPRFGSTGGGDLGCLGQGSRQPGREGLGGCALEPNGPGELPRLAGGVADGNCRQGFFRACGRAGRWRGGLRHGNADVAGGLDGWLPPAQRGALRSDPTAPAGGPASVPGSRRARLGDRAWPLARISRPRRARSSIFTSARTIRAPTRRV